MIDALARQTQRRNSVVANPPVRIGRLEMSKAIAPLLAIETGSALSQALAGD